MLYLEDNVLNFSFPEVHEQARLKIKLLRTLRVPDDGNSYPLPVRLGTFPVRHVEDAGVRVPELWLNRGGVMVPMYQAEAMILEFDSDAVEGRANYPFAVKVGTGKINAVTGRAWTSEINQPLQDYVVPPRQQWLDGYNVAPETVRQFIAMPLGKGLTAEEQITGCHTWGGIQLQAYPMKREAFDKYFPPPKPSKERAIPTEPLRDTGKISFSIAHRTEYILGNEKCHPMGMAPGGKVQQLIYPDTYGSDVWDKTQTSRSFVHLCNSAQWKAITGENTLHPLADYSYVPNVAIIRSPANQVGRRQRAQSAYPLSAPPARKKAGEHWLNSILAPPISMRLSICWRTSLRNWMARPSKCVKP